MNKLDGFLYIKEEDSPINSEPPLEASRRLKVGTFKINARQTKLGERFMKRIFDLAIQAGVEEIYVTVLEKHEALVRLFYKYGFVKRSEIPRDPKPESVLIRRLAAETKNPMTDYPFIHVQGHAKYLLAIHPKYHTPLFPDSILNSETYDVVQDLSHTNSIHKVYITTMPVEVLSPGDVIVMYRTSDGKGPALYRSVATTVCVVEKVRQCASFTSEIEFLRYCKPYSVFTEFELKRYYRNKETRVIRLTYNAAMTKRVTRKVLLEDVGLDENARWSFIRLTDNQFEAILGHGEVSANLIVD